MNKLRIASFVLAFAKTCDNEEIENAYDSPFPAHNEGTSTIQTVALSKVESDRKDDRRGDSSHNIIADLFRNILYKENCDLQSIWVNP